MSQSRLAVLIPTYRRPALLAKLLGDLAAQTRLPDELWIVDGEGRSEATRAAVAASDWTRAGRLTGIVESTRANLPFQRYVGRLAADSCDCLIYFDDDVRLRSRDAVARLAEAVEQGAAGATAEIRMDSTPRRGFAALLGAARRAKPGALTASGSRVAPVADQQPYPRVEWMRGGAMAFRTAALPASAFPGELLELAEQGYGLGEDLILGCIARRAGDLALVRGVDVEHPGADATRSYATDPEGRGYARAAGRRLLADYRSGSAAGLWAAHAGAILAALLPPRTGAALYIRGYLLGATAAARTGRLCPPNGVDWRREARASLQACSIIDRRAA